MENKDIFEKLLQEYYRKKTDYAEKKQSHGKAYRAWYEEVAENGGFTEKAVLLGSQLDRAMKECDELEREYNYLAHAVLEYM